MTHKWNEDETEYFVTVMEELVIEGQRADAGQFKPGSFEKIAKKMNEKYPGASFTANHCKNKHKRLKEKYQSAADMAACSGFGWSDEKQCVLVDSKEVLEQYIKQHPLRFYSPGKPFPLFLRLEAVFGKDRANGMFSMSGVDAEEHVAQESDICMTVEETEMNNITAEESDAQFQTSPIASSAENKRGRITGNKRSRGDDVLLTLSDSMKTVVGQQGNHIQILANALCGVNEEVNVGHTLTRLGFSTDEIVQIAMRFVQVPALKEMFWSLMDDQKAAFVESVLHN